MQQHLDLLKIHGAQFGHTMVQKIMQEANAMSASGRDYKLSEHLREGMIHRAAAWKEALILHEFLKEFNHE